MAIHPISWTRAKGQHAEGLDEELGDEAHAPGKGVPLMRSQPPWMLRKSISVLSMRSSRCPSRRPASLRRTTAASCRSSRAWVRLVLLRRPGSSSA